MKLIYTTEYVDGMTCPLKRCSTCKLLHGRKDYYCLNCRQAYMRMRAYGINREQYAALLEKQEGACGICMEPFTQEPHVDHDHKTNKVRGLLCQNCNTGIGKLGDTVQGLLRAATYLAKI